MKKIAYCTLYLPHYRSDIFDYIVKNYNINITVLADQSPNNGFMLKHSNNVAFTLKEIKVSKFKLPFINKYIYWIPSYFKVLFQPYDVYIMSNRMTQLTVWICMILAKILNKKIWLWGHGRGSEKSKPGKYLRKIFMRLSYGCLFYDYETTQEWKKKLPKKLMVTVPNTLDNIKIENTFKSKFGVSIDDFLEYEIKSKNIILFIGRLTKEKEPDLLILAIKEIIKIKNDIICYFIGDGEMKNKMEKMIEKYSLKDYIKIIGEIYEEDELANYFFNAKLTVIPAYAGLSINHSFCYGVPVVVDNNFKIHGPEAKIVKDGVNGFIFKEKDYINLCNIIYNYLINENLQYKMAKASRETIRNCYNINNMAESFINSMKL